MAACDGNRSTRPIALLLLFESCNTTVLLDGKSFNPNTNSFDNSAHYGKHVFAEKVVKANQAKIDFRGFDPLLRRIDEVIEDYAFKLTS